jgi:AcrR family transcriptional regulator
MAELSRRERERAQHRRLILAAAEQVFAEKGYHAATMHEIAERAEFSVGSLYNFFENKTDLYRELIDMRAEEFSTDVRERLEREPDVLGKLRAAIRAKLDFFRRNQDFFQLFARLHSGEELEGPVALPEKTRRLYLEATRRLVLVMDEGIRRGVVVDCDPMVLALCLEGMTNSAIGHWMQGGDSAEGMPSADVIEQVLFHGILAEGS